MNKVKEVENSNIYIGRNKEFIVVKKKKNRGSLEGYKRFTGESRGDLVNYVEEFEFNYLGNGGLLSGYR